MFAMKTSSGPSLCFLRDMLVVTSLLFLAFKQFVLPLTHHVSPPQTIVFSLSLLKHLGSRTKVITNYNSRKIVMKQLVLYGLFFVLFRFSSAYGLWTSNAAGFQPEPVPLPDSVSISRNECNKHAFGSTRWSSTSVSSMFLLIKYMSQCACVLVQAHMLDSVYSLFSLSTLMWDLGIALRFPGLNGKYHFLLIPVFTRVASNDVQKQFVSNLYDFERSPLSFHL